MRLYTTFSIIISGLLTMALGINPSFIPVFYGLIFVGMLPGYWSCERNLEEKWAISISNFIILIGQIIVLGMIFRGLVRGFASEQIATIASSGIFLNLSITLMVMWLGLFFFSVWCGYPEEKVRRRRR